MLEGDIEETEVLNVIEQMALNKMMDYQWSFTEHFWPNIKRSYYECLC